MAFLSLINVYAAENHMFYVHPLFFVEIAQGPCYFLLFRRREELMTVFTMLALSRVLFASVEYDYEICW